MVDVASVGLVIVLAGVATIFTALLRSSAKGDGRAKGAAVVLVGPIPIVIGSDAKWASVAIVLAIFLVALGLILYMGLP
ncbi:MAG TPA: DUF131 domain-containing protein [Nitrososphaerales archaeon]|nr:DUF131 domain-containing protein [Nitrososphaerales archaeon]